MRRVNLALVALFATTATTYAATTPAWQDEQVNQINRAPMHTNYFAFNSEEEAKGCRNKSENFLSLNGTWQFNWVEHADQRPTEFFKVDYNDKGWDTMQVPAVWELNGYGDPIYVNSGYQWREQFKSDPPHVPIENNHVGSYRREVEIPASWSGTDVFIHFGAVSTNVTLWVNGREVGYSEDSKLEAEFDITKYLKKGKNLIAFQIIRWCDGTYFEDQDYWRFTGVSRDCYLYSREKSRIDDIRIVPDLDAEYRDATLSVDMTMRGKGEVELSLTDAKGEQVTSKKVAVAKSAKAQFDVENPLKWSAEEPNLYTLTATLRSGGKVLEVIKQQVGFRKIELKNSQVLINGKPVLFKGANRHEIDPDYGYVISRERMEQDIRRMKQLNINAVRTCHYPDNNYWYELCDKYGIYVVAEANLETHGMGYGDKTLATKPSFLKTHLERNMRNVQRGYNHPSIIFWSLANESGMGENFEECYRWVKAEDPSRLCQHEGAVNPMRLDMRDEGMTYDEAFANRREMFSYSDTYCPMYARMDEIPAYLENDTQKPMILCEYAHAMGNSMGGFKDYWDEIRKYPAYQGGFIWDFVDQAIRWRGKDGVEIFAYGGDFNRYDASNNNFLNNGIISPERKFNPHAYEVQYYHQSIWSELTEAQGKVEIYNENFFRDLSAYVLEWNITSNGKVVKYGVVSDLSVAPQSREVVDLGYTLDGMCTGRELLLNLSYRLKRSEMLLEAGEQVAHQQLELTPYRFPELQTPSCDKKRKSCGAAPAIKDNDRNYLIINGDNFTIEFGRKDGWMSRYCVNGEELLTCDSKLRPNFWRALTDNDYGARLFKAYNVWRNPTFRLKSLKKEQVEDRVVVNAEYTIEQIATPLTLTYEITKCGAVKVTQSMTAVEGEAVPAMFRFGMRVEMPKSYQEIEFYGRGPHENYSDRKWSAPIGIYRQEVKDQYYSYIRPQESGTKCDLRWWRVLDSKRSGLEIVSDEPFSASALDYTLESLEDEDAPDQRHSAEVERSNMTNLSIDKAQMGLGCVNSWSETALERYQLPYADYSFTFVLRPVR